MNKSNARGDDRVEIPMKRRHSLTIQREVNNSDCKATEYVFKLTRGA